MRIRPDEAFQFAILKGIASSRGFIPGTIIESLSAEMREVLKELKPKDTEVRIDAIFVTKKERRD